MQSKNEADILPSWLIKNLLYRHENVTEFAV